jgi:hypothetical protein
MNLSRREDCVSVSADRDKYEDSLRIVSIRKASVHDVSLFYSSVHEASLQEASVHEAFDRSKSSELTKSSQ